MASTAIKSAAIGIPIIGGTGTGVTYQLTKKTPLDVLKNKNAKIIDKDDEAWAKMFEKLKSNTNGGFKTGGFRDLMNDAKKSPPKLNKEQLYDYCESEANRVYSTIFSSDRYLLEDIEKACTINNGGAMGDGSYGTTVENLDSNSLKEYTDSLDSEGVLKTTRESLKSDNNHSESKQKHAKWCEETSSKIYLGKDDPKYKIFKEVCKKKSG